MQTIKLHHVKIIDHYSAGSAMTRLNDKLYLIGDNMGYIIVLNTQFDIVDTISVLDGMQSPMSQAAKADIEAATIVNHKGDDALLILGSGSLDSNRNNAWLIDIINKQKHRIDLSPLFARLKISGIRELNIEGAATVKDKIVLANRGNNAVPENHLIIVNDQLLENPVNCPFTIIPVKPNKNSPIFNGISGLEYSRDNDLLIATVSTEDTRTSYTDGTIGKSYLWLFYDFSLKLDSADLSPDQVYDLEEIDHRFKGHKMETACILSQKKKEITLALAADDDDDYTTLFKIIVPLR